MRTMTWGPARELFTMHRGLDRFFDELAVPETAPSFTPAVDVEETASHFLFAFDLPGVRQEDVKIEVIDKRLTVTGEKKATPRGDGKTETAPHLIERSHGTFQRTFTLPTAIDAEKIEAVYDSGVLRISIPKAEAAKPRQVQIRAVT